MEPGAEPEPSRRRERSLTAKRSLLDEYDKADYKARQELLDREQLTIRQISRWRSELRMAARKKAARRPAASAAAGKTATSRGTTASSGRATARKTPAKRAKAPASRTKRTATPVEPAAADDDMAVPAAAPASLRASAKPASRDAGADRAHPRRTGTRSKATSGDDVAVVHAEALIYHTAALDRLLASRGETGPSGVVLTRLRSAAREAHEAAWAFLEQVLKPDATRPAGSNTERHRRPWWGSKDAPPPPAPTASTGRPRRWGR